MEGEEDREGEVEEGGGNRLPDHCVAEQCGLWHCHNCCHRRSRCCCCQMTTGQREKERKTREGQFREDTAADGKDY